MKITQARPSKNNRSKKPFLPKAAKKINKQQTDPAPADQAPAKPTEQETDNQIIAPDGLPETSQEPEPLF